jgi:hypothetical protein
MVDVLDPLLDKISQPYLQFATNYHSLGGRWIQINTIN